MIKLSAKSTIMITKNTQIRAITKKINKVLDLKKIEVETAKVRIA